MPLLGTNNWSTGSSSTTSPIFMSPAPVMTKAPVLGARCCLPAGDSRGSDDILREGIASTEGVPTSRNNASGDTRNVSQRMQTKGVSRRPTSVVVGFQVLLHAIGDKAINMALNSFGYAAKTNGTSGRRHRVEHGEVPRLADLPRFKQLGVIASTQALFAMPDATVLTNYAVLLGPERASHANAFKLYDDAGAARRIRTDGPEIDHAAVSIQKRVTLPRCVIRVAGDVTLPVDAISNAARASQSAQIERLAVSIPKCMKGRQTAAEVGHSNDFAAVIEARRVHEVAAEDRESSSACPARGHRDRRFGGR